MTLKTRLPLLAVLLVAVVGCDSAEPEGPLPPMSAALNGVRWSADGGHAALVAPGHEAIIFGSSDSNAVALHFTWIEGQSVYPIGEGPGERPTRALAWIGH